jgi:histidinol-phosphate phosphatase family protein
MDKAIILDKDGTLVDDPNYYVYKLEDFKLLPGVVEGLKNLSKEFIFIIVTNQSGIGRGIFTEEDMHKFNNKLLNELKKESIDIKKIYHCPHKKEEGCSCRKPSTKYIEEAAKEFNIDIKNSWVIGDHLHDIEMGMKANCRNVYMLTGHGKKHLDDLEKEGLKPDFIAEDFFKAADFIMNNKKQ